jgi:hypothetical protein
LAVSDGTPLMVMSSTIWGRLSALMAASYTLHTVISALCQLKGLCSAHSKKEIV